MSRLVPHPTDVPLESPASAQEKMIDPVSILRAYDQAAVDLFDIVTPSDRVKRLYGREELVTYSVQRLRDLATKLDVFADTDNKDSLLKSIINAQRIPVVLASPAPPFAHPEQTTGRKETSTQSINVRYPIISIQRLGIRRALGRWNGAKRRKLGWNYNKFLVLQSAQPTPIDISYQVEFITTTSKHMNIIDEYVSRLWLRPNVNVDIDHGLPFGTRTVQVFNDDQYSDSTVYEHGSEEAEKMLRHIYTIRFEGWMPNESEWARTVIREVREYWDSVSNTELESITTDLRDDPA